MDGRRYRGGAATEVAAWTALKSAPSEAGALFFIADRPSGHFRPKAEALLAKLQAPKSQKKQSATRTSDTAPAPVVTPQLVAPAATQPCRDAGTRRHHCAIAEEFRETIERYVRNSQSVTGKHRFLAINNEGSRIGIGQCDKIGYWDGCGGWRILYEGADKVAVFRDQVLLSLAARFRRS